MRRVAGDGGQVGYGLVPVVVLVDHRGVHKAEGDVGKVGAQFVGAGNLTLGLEVFKQANRGCQSYLKFLYLQCMQKNLVSWSKDHRF